MDAHDRCLLERFAKIDGAIRALIDEVARLNRHIDAERDVTMRALAAMMLRIEDLEQRK